MMVYRNKSHFWLEVLLYKNVAKDVSVLEIMT